MNKHTPAPWKVVKRGKYIHELMIFGSNDKSVCDAQSTNKGQEPTNEQIANARLIAAAPELLEALIHVESLFGVLAVEDLPNIPSKTLVEMIQSLKTAREAIEKSTGK